MYIWIVSLLFCAVWAAVASVLIAIDLEKRGLPVSIFWLRLKIFGYLHQYRTITRQETGRVGPLYYHYVVPLIAALVVAILMVIKS